MLTTNYYFNCLRNLLLRACNILKPEQLMTQLFKNGQQQVKMIDFVNYLYKKHKVLNKLSEKQSRDFQAEIVNILVDSNQNVDRETFQDINLNIGFEVFILQTLANVINRNPFKNQYELKRNLDVITQNIKKQQEELHKRQKMLQRRQQKIKTAEQQILSTCKQKIVLMEAEAMRKIQAKQAQVKKSLSVLLSQLKAKQKVILQRHEFAKSNKQTLAKIEQRQKGLTEKLKQLDRKQREIKSKDLQQSLLKKDNKLNQLQEHNLRLRETITELNTKLKNMELAYRKVKGQNQKLANQNKKVKSQNEHRNQGSKKQIEKPNIKKGKEHLKIELQDLQLSVIEHKVDLPIKQHKNEHREELQCLELQNSQKIQQFCDCIEPSKYEDSRLSFLQSQQQDDPHEKLIKQIGSIDLNDITSKQKLLNSGLLLEFFDKAALLRYPLLVCIQLLQMMLPLMQMDEANATVAAYLKQQALIGSIQKIYLCHQTSCDIAEASTLILSRIKIWNGGIMLQQSFRKAIQIRKRVQSQNTILCLNIKNLLQ